MFPEDGWFVSFDYVGAHRNQYRLDAWEEVWKLNRQIPTSLRQDLLYPPIPTMMVVDPTEAVHSELIVRTFHRYFAEVQFTPLGGAIAYPLLTHNARMSTSEDDATRSHWIEQILNVDDSFLREHPESTLFAYFAGTPRKKVLADGDRLAAWEAEKLSRERRAHERGGEYYDRGPLATALIELEEQQVQNEGLHSRIEQLESELRAMQSRYLYARARRLADSKVTEGPPGQWALHEPRAPATGSLSHDFAPGRGARVRWSRPLTPRRTTRRRRGCTRAGAQGAMTRTPTRGVPSHLDP